MDGLATAPGRLSGWLCIGYDDGDAVSSLYRPRNAFTAGTLHRVTFHAGEDLHVDREQHLQAAIARD